VKHDDPDRRGPALVDTKRSALPTCPTGIDSRTRGKIDLRGILNEPWVDRRERKPLPTTAFDELLIISLATMLSGVEAMRGRP
jgi:hypothetical protein